MAEMEATLMLPTTVGAARLNKEPEAVPARKVEVLLKLRPKPLVKPLAWAKIKLPLVRPLA